MFKSIARLINSWALAACSPLRVTRSHELFWLYSDQLFFQVRDLQR